MFGLKFKSLLVAALSLSTAAAASEIGPARFNAAEFADIHSDGIEPAIVKAQILLSHANISPGGIDGKYSARLDEAIKAFAEANGLLPAGTGWSSEFWLALTATAQSPVLSEYVVTKEDLSRPFVQLPARMEDMKSFKTLGYGSLREALAEKFHMSDELLVSLNPDASFAEVGERIIVANLTSDRKQLPQAARIDVDKDRQTVKAYSEKNELLAFFPASIGGEDKPSPSGTLKVTLIEEDPSFHYNPRYHFKEIETQKPFDLNPGPNNPLGTRWIALSKPSYGIHGTPEPSQIGKAASHGCVRLTNWDVRRLAGILSKGTPVNFIETSRSAPHTALTAY
jgi:lipoprotein-anchoring transpeptidase ErfK/SrfK